MKLFLRRNAPLFYMLLAMIVLYAPWMGRGYVNLEYPFSMAARGFPMGGMQPNRHLFFYSSQSAWVFVCFSGDLQNLWLPRLVLASQVAFTIWRTNDSYFWVDANS
ncbi:hypothetical protein EMGBS4_16470 [Acidimicrobiaceae bacterium]|nr:hypothetical protein EMGBS4_16470 [Acidimicrobiaceae bacterium]